MTKSPFSELIDLINSFDEDRLRQEIKAAFSEDTIKPSQLPQHVTNTIRSYHDQIESLQDNITRLLDYVDSFVPGLIARLETEINSVPAAYDAVFAYNANWFSEQVFSDNSLAKIAKTLADKTEKYGLTPNPFWHKIIIGDMSDLQFPKRKLDAPHGYKQMRLSDVESE